MYSAATASRQYSSLSEHTRNAKDLEYEVFLGVTRELSECVANAAKDFPKLAKILNKNERLWIEIGTQVADSDNLLDADLRARLFYLAEFVSLHTSKVLRREADVAPLVETNIAVLRGLKGRG